MCWCHLALAGWDFNIAPKSVISIFFCRMSDIQQALNGSFNQMVMHLGRIYVFWQTSDRLACFSPNPAVFITPHLANFMTAFRLRVYIHISFTNSIIRLKCRDATNLDEQRFVLKYTCLIWAVAATRDNSWCDCGGDGVAYCQCSIAAVINPVQRASDPPGFSVLPGRKTRLDCGIGLMTLTRGAWWQPLVQICAAADTMSLSRLKQTEQKQMSRKAARSNLILINEL